MAHPLLATDAKSALPLWLATQETWSQIAESLPAPARAFASAQGFEAKPGTHCLLPDAEGGLFGAAFGIDGPSAKRPDPFLPGKLPTLLPDGVYRFEGGSGDLTLATLAWLLGGYSFNRYRQRNGKTVRLVPPAGVDADEVSRIAQAVAASRDLVNTPTNDLGPDGIGCPAAGGTLRGILHERDRR